jgi:hypothetical protein
MLMKAIFVCSLYLHSLCIALQRKLPKSPYRGRRITRPAVWGSPWFGLPPVVGFPQVGGSHGFGFPLAWVFFWGSPGPSPTPGQKSSFVQLDLTRNRSLLGPLHFPNFPLVWGSSGLGFLWFGVPLGLGFPPVWGSPWFGVPPGLGFLLVLGSPWFGVRPGLGGDGKS